MEPVKIKILGISCGHRKGRNTAWMTLCALKAAEKACRRMDGMVDIEIELIDFAERKMKPCIDCGASCETDADDYECLIKDDYIATELIPRMIEADGFVFGAPVFTGSYTSKFITLFERLRAHAKRGYFTNKPAVGVTTATMLLGGQETCLGFMDICMRAVGMIPVHWLNGATGVSGPPWGPLPGADDGTEIAAKNDRYGQWLSTVCGRRVAEMAVIQKIAKRRLGGLYDKEFIQTYRKPQGDADWEWTELDKSDEKLMAGLDRGGLEALDGAVLNKPGGKGVKKPTCKILGLSCDNIKGRDTSWLVVRSLKAVEKFGRRIESVGGFETEFIDLADKNMRPCLNCDKRYEIPNGGIRWEGPEYPKDFGCIIKNDYLAKEILPKIAEADGFIFGSSVSAQTPSYTFRVFHERLGGVLSKIVAKGSAARKPTTNIAVAYDSNGGQESCLNMMNTCNRWLELIPISWPQGTPALGGGENILAKDDEKACFLSSYNARRVAEISLMFKLAEQELAGIFEREFLKIVHPPHGDASWEWTKLEKEDWDYMKSLTPDELSKVGNA